MDRKSKLYDAKMYLFVSMTNVKDMFMYRGKCRCCKSAAVGKTKFPHTKETISRPKPETVFRFSFRGRFHFSILPYKFIRRGAQSEGATPTCSFYTFLFSPTALHFGICRTSQKNMYLQLKIYIFYYERMISLIWNWYFTIENINFPVLNN